MASAPSVLVRPREDLRWSAKREDTIIGTVVDAPGLLETELQRVIGKFTYDHSDWKSLRDQIDAQQQVVVNGLRKYLAPGEAQSGVLYGVRLHVLDGYSGAVPPEETWLSWLRALPEKLEPKVVRYYDCLGRPTTCLTPFKSSDPYYMSGKGPPRVPSEEELGLTAPIEEIAESIRNDGNAYLLKVDQSYCCVHPTIGGIGSTLEQRWQSELVLAVLYKAKVPDIDVKLSFSLRDGLLGVNCQNCLGEQIATLHWDPCLGRSELRSALAAQLQQPEWRLNFSLEDGQPFDTSVPEADEDSLPMSPNSLLTDLVCIGPPFKGP